MRPLLVPAMDGVVDDPMALYPMVEEATATGTVAAVYAQIVAVMPIVPSVFKSLALCPPYLVLAWVRRPRRSRAGLRPGRGGAACLGACGDPTARDPRIREALARFVTPLSQMLLLSAGSAEALAGRLPGDPAPGHTPPAAGPSLPRWRVTSAAQTGDENVYGDIRAALLTPLINSIWRSLAEQGLLETAWGCLSPHVAQTRQTSRTLSDQARRTAHELAWPVIASPAALDTAGVGDAGPGVAAILDCYLTTLPRVLALVASSTA